jgi:hypothetical protein
MFNREVLALNKTGNVRYLPHRVRVSAIRVLRPLWQNGSRHVIRFTSSARVRKVSGRQSKRLRRSEVADQYSKEAVMVSLTQAQSIADLEADGWMVVEPSSKQAKGGPILMKRQSDGRLSHILVTPNGERSSPTAAQIRDW